MKPMRKILILSLPNSQLGNHQKLHAQTYFAKLSATNFSRLTKSKQSLLALKVKLTMTHSEIVNLQLKII